jgi:tetratricopeptide (TPR) repeat protein
MNDRIPLPTQSYLDILQLNLTPQELLVQFPDPKQQDFYIGVIGLFTHGAVLSTTDKLRRFHGYLEAFSFLEAVSDWSRAWELISSPLVADTGVDFLEQLGYWGYHAKIIELCQKVLPYVEQRQQALVLSRTAMAYDNLNQLEQAISTYEECLALAEQQNIMVLARDTLFNLGNLQVRCRDYIQAERIYAQVESITQTLQADLPTERNQRLALGLVINRGQIAAATGMHSQAITYFDQALGLARQLGDRDGEVMILDALGVTANRWGDYAGAQKHLTAALALNRELGNRAAELSVLVNLANAYYFAQDFKGAEACYEQILQVPEPFLDTTSRINGLHGLGNMCYERGECELAHDYFVQAQNLGVQSGDQYSVAVSLANIGSNLGRWQRPTEAIAYLLEALELLRSVDGLAVDMMASISHRVAGIYHELGMVDQAQLFLDTAIAIAEEYDLPILAECRALQDQLPT